MVRDGAVSTERSVPHDLEAEEAVLGSLLLDVEALPRVSAYLTAQDLFREKHAWIYEACLALVDRGEPVDVVTLSHELSRCNQLEAVGGVAYLSHLATVVPTAVHVEHYAAIVHRCAIMRRLIAAAGQIAAIGYQAPQDVDGALARAEELLFAVRQQRTSRDFVHLRDILDRFLEESTFTRPTPEGALPHVATGFIELDKLLGGLQRSDLIILAARPSLGKSSLALNVAHSAALRQNATVAIFSLEMSKEQIAQRLLCSEAGVDSQRLRLGYDHLSHHEQRRISDAIGVLSGLGIYIDDSPLNRVSEMRLKAKRLSEDVGVDLIIIDYLQLAHGSARNDNRVQEISEISRSLKALARELDVPVLALSQLSRAVETRSPHIPMLSDLRESGSLEQDADVVMFIYRDDVYHNEAEWERQNPGKPYPRGIANVIVSKHRNGPTGSISLLFFEKTTRFANLELGRS